jgi:hypothetical protein
VKLDWDATFRNRIRHQLEQGRAPMLPPPEAKPPTPAPDALSPAEAKVMIAKIQLALRDAGRVPGGTGGAA